MSLWASMLVHGGHNENYSYRLVTNKYSALSSSVLLSWLDCSVLLTCGNNQLPHTAQKRLGYL